MYLEVVPDAALFEGSRIGILDGEIPTAEDLVAHVHAVAIPQHPGVLVAHHGPGGGKVWDEQLENGPLRRSRRDLTDLRTTRMKLSRRMLRIPAKYNSGVVKQCQSRVPRV